jgi:CRP-like cAMP-binding protein
LPISFLVLEVLVVNSDLLAGFPLFRDISPEVLGKIAALSEELSFNEGQSVFREGEKADKLHFLLKGSIALRVNIMSKPESVTVSFVSKANECFGWSGLVEPHYYTASAFCEEPSRILDIAGKQLLKILSDNPEAGFMVMHRVAEMISYRLRNSRLALLKTL